MIQNVQKKDLNYNSTFCFTYMVKTVGTDTGFALWQGRRKNLEMSQIPLTPQ